MGLMSGLEKEQGSSKTLLIKLDNLSVKNQESLPINNIWYCNKTCEEAVISTVFVCVRTPE